MAFGALKRSVQRLLFHSSRDKQRTCKIGTEPSERTDDFTRQGPVQLDKRLLEFNFDLKPERSATPTEEPNGVDISPEKDTVCSIPQPPFNCRIKV